MIKGIFTLLFSFCFCLIASADSFQFKAGKGTLFYKGAKGPGKGKHIVLVAGDEEYRSEEAMPVLARILAEQHGFRTTVLFSTDANGTINPGAQQSLMGAEAFDSADLIILSIRFRNWPNAAMTKFDAALKRGTPVIGLRTSTHAFKIPDKNSPFHHYHCFNKEGGFGRKILGEKWVTHWGNHGSQATRAVIEKGAERNPILNGVGEIFGDSDVYSAYPPEDATVLMRGLVLSSMSPNSKPVTSKKKDPKSGKMVKINDPAMPVVWTREISLSDKKKTKVLTTTMGAMTDLMDEGLRRLVVNGAFWALDLKIPRKAAVPLPNGFKASAFKFGGYQKGKKAIDFAK